MRISQPGEGVKDRRPPEAAALRAVLDPLAGLGHEAAMRSTGQPARPVRTASPPATPHSETSSLVMAGLVPAILVNLVAGAVSGFRAALLPLREKVASRSDDG